MSRSILIHHHARVFHGDTLHLQSFIGAWVQELSKHFERVGLLMHETSSREVKQDFEVSAANVELISLGPNGGLRDRQQRIKRIRRICKGLTNTYDILLIRGITPRQLLIYNNVEVPLKSFLLVGSLKDGKPNFGLSVGKLYAYLMFNHRLREFKKIARNSLLMGNSPRLVEEIKEITGKEAHFIPTNSIAHSHFSNSQRNYSEPELRILFVGRVHQDKGIRELFHAFNALDNPDGQTYILDVVGPCSEELKAELLSLLDQDKAARVSFYGFVPFGIELLEYYRKAHFYVLPSYHEGFPHSIWEAGCSNTPVITTPVGGIPGIVNEDQVFFVEKGSSSDIVSAIVQLQSNATIRNGMTASLYELAKDFTVEEAVSDLSTLLSR